MIHVPIPTKTIYPGPFLNPNMPALEVGRCGHQLRGIWRWKVQKFPVHDSDWAEEPDVRHPALPRGTVGVPPHVEVGYYMYLCVFIVYLLFLLFVVLLFCYFVVLLLLLCYWSLFLYYHMWRLDIMHLCIFIGEVRVREKRSVCYSEGCAP